MFPVIESRKLVRVREDVRYVVTDNSVEIKIDNWTAEQPLSEQLQFVPVPGPLELKGYIEPDTNESVQRLTVRGYTFA
jgi:hypothetical protein